jgi:hypothetical protein
MRKKSSLYPNGYALNTSWNYEDKGGLYNIELTTSLKDYPLVKPSSTLFSIRVLPPCGYLKDEWWYWNGFWTDPIKEEINLFTDGDAVMIDGLFMLMRPEYMLFENDRETPKNEASLLCGKRKTIAKPCSGAPGRWKTKNLLKKLMTQTDYPGAYGM